MTRSRLNRRLPLVLWLSLAPNPPGYVCNIGILLGLGSTQINRFGSNRSAKYNDANPIFAPRSTIAPSVSRNFGM